MKPFFNSRIETPFEESFKGYNQYIYTGCIDDLFLMDTVAKGAFPRLCRIAEALAEYGHRAGYDLVITLREDLTPTFGSAEQERLFQELTQGSSGHLVAEGRKSMKFQPRPRSGDVRTSGTSNPAAASQAKAVEDTRQQVHGNDAINRLERITRVLKTADRRVLVIFPYPEKMIPTGSADGTAIQKMEVVVKSWRDIVQEANPNSRTVLIVNPHRLKEFHEIEQYLSCYDHNCREITVPPPPVDEMRSWLSTYRMENNIQGAPRSEERVVLAGKANAGGNLQNFVSWVQSYFQRNPDKRQWDSLLADENHEAAESKEDLLEQLDGLVGLEEVKKEIHSIVDNAEKNNAAAADASYHMFFLGNPGTGKTVVANIIARLFWAMELRTSKKTVTIAIQDIVSQYNEGDTLQRMKDKIQEAMGGVLFIDEAYLFAESEWGRKAFQVLLTEMENNRRNLTVILAGYEERLQALKDINPGIDSRIPIKLHFKDYSKDEKLEIFRLHLENEDKKQGLRHVIEPGAEVKLLRILEWCEGNGRGVRNVLERTLKRVQSCERIKAEDIQDPHEVHPEDAEMVLKEIDENFIGMDTLKDQLRKYFRQVRWNVDRARELGLTRRSGHAYRIRFTGPPGTGKTSIARYMGRFFHAMGVCETSECKECGATTLKGAYVGHAQQAVNNLFHENRGKVIFIDEIYSLYNPEARQDDSFSREVIDTLVRCLTAEEYQNTVVIVAGYKDKVDQFMFANPGLASRIPAEIEFENYSAEDCVRIFEAVARKESYRLAEGCREKLRDYFECLRKGPNFGNARDVYGTFSLVESRLVDRVSGMDADKKTREDYTVIQVSDIPSAPEGLS